MDTVISAPSPPPVLDEVRCRRLVIVDEEGHERIVAIANECCAEIAVHATIAGGGTSARLYADSASTPSWAGLMLEDGDDVVASIDVTGVHAEGGTAVYQSLAFQSVESRLEAATETLASIVDAATHRLSKLDPSGCKDHHGADQDRFVEGDIEIDEAVAAFRAFAAEFFRGTPGQPGRWAASIEIESDEQVRDRLFAILDHV